VTSIYEEEIRKLIQFSGSEKKKNISSLAGSFLSINIAATTSEP
jgi:hypothetical protein